MNDIAIRTSGLGKRYRQKWALRGCDIEVPAGRVVGLVGPNGAGKSTLMNLAVGLLAPTEGTLEVLGREVRANTVLHRVAYIDQEHTMYRNFTVREMVKTGRKLNARWDDRIAFDRLAELNIPLDSRIGALSGGQRAQVALAVALAKEPELLILDEPVASLDPLARRELMSVLMEAKADSGCTVVLSSHVVSELERLCDYLIVLDRGQVKLADDIDDLLEQHHLLVGPAAAAADVAGVVHREDRGDRVSLLVRGDRPAPGSPWDVQHVDLETLVMHYLSAAAPTRLREVAA
ncbi:ABC-2 type transport system ATP-binding protein [Saccharopolyspora kobensis]|uniref:ABC-2 type transport system ATP-binding protein n=1 Tax=Saccharopolyspora kobensis TaxID=146035 RepID=A0A1H6E1D1_9PSEU|nr:ABC transporter ATP-binding protein [Saccharopolyspora kobensis]SEG91410.1 ABC-2 type transport system ATP-binding protein [Saccharopolyspora kobensis]SFF15373.1 ABC-2 type transport system ATP-binding protein [Saccharopolyspora kobensis]